MTNMTPFIFEDQHFVRTLTQQGEPWFVLTDVCRVLGIGNPSQAASRLDEDERMTLINNEGHSGQRGGAQSFTIINESGLYSLILTSRKPAAKRFKKWVTSEVLPSIRKTGAYDAGQNRRAADLTEQRQALRLVADLKQEREPEIRQMLHAMLGKVLDGMGIAPPPLEAFSPKQPPGFELCEPFWAAVAKLEAQGVDLNHAHDQALIALSLPDLRRHFAKAGLHVGIGAAMHKALKLSQQPRFVAVKVVNSRLTRKPTKCWVFEQPIPELAL